MMIAEVEMQSTKALIGIHAYQPGRQMKWKPLNLIGMRHLGAVVRIVPPLVSYNVGKKEW